MRTGHKMRPFVAISIRHKMNWMIDTKAFCVQHFVARKKIGMQALANCDQMRLENGRLIYRSSHQIRNSGVVVVDSVSNSVYAA